MATTRPTRYTWDERTSRYRDATTGRFVPPATVNRAMNETLLESEKRTTDLANRLRRGEISVDQWVVEMRTEIKTAHLWNAAASRGGWAQMDAADFGRVGQIVRGQYEYLYRFATQIAGGLPLDGRFIARARMYVEAGRGTRDHFAMLEQGDYTEERNILGSAEHCEECLAYTAGGPSPGVGPWKKRGTMKPPGQRLCRSKCKCRREFR